MKKYLLLLVAIAFVVLQKANAQTPVAYYPFNGNANDAIGSLHGTVNGATLTTDRFGNPNSAYSFDGVNNFIGTSALALSQNQDWTITAWVKASTLLQNSTVVLNGFDNGTPGGAGYAMIMDGVPNGTPGNLIKLLYPGQTSTNSGLSLNSTTTWYHIAIVRDAGGIGKIYLNGQLSGSTTNASINPAGGTFRIGSASGINFFNGAIDEVKVYNTTLTTLQIQHEFAQPDYSNLFGNSVQTNGINDRISFTHPFNAENFTIEMWVKPGATQVQYANLIDNSHNSVVNWVCQQNDNNINRYGFGINRTSGGGIGGDFTLTANVWQHVALLKSSTALEVYVNGIVVLSLPWSGTINYSNPNISLCDVAGGGRKWNGTMDEVRIWNTARSQTEIVANMNSQLTGNEPGLVAYYDMNRDGQGTGLTVENKATATGAALNGTTVGTANTPVFGPGVVQHKPGSGNAISFDGNDDVVTVPNSANLQFSGDLTVDFWVNIPQTQNNTANPDNSILEKWAGNNGSIGYPFVFRYIRATHNVVFNRYDGSSGVSIVSTAAIDDDKWHHVTATKTGSLLSLYVDGVLQSTGTDLSNLSNVNNTDKLSIGSRGLLASQPNNLTGSVDEVRIWNSSLTQSQIRDRMCRKITSSDALYTSLLAYYNFDEGAANNTFDGTNNNNNGIITNGATRVASGAAIGDGSAHDYISATKAASIAHASGESFTVTSSSGNPDAIQIYRVDELPNTLTGTQGVGSNKKYFGVFQVGGSSPTYQAVYDYTGNPGVDAGNESTLALYKRNDNAVTSWVNAVAVLNTTANTLTLTGESTEYLLGSTGFALPLSLTSFSGSKQGNDALLQWKTANEINVSRFEIQRSDNGQNFIPVSTVTPGNFSYSFTDVNIFNSKSVVFYRLKSIDVDGRFTTSAIIRLSSKQINPLTVYPNPAKNIITVSSSKKQDAVIINTIGQVVGKIQLVNGSQVFNVTVLGSGIYYIKTNEGIIKLIKE